MLDWLHMLSGRLVAIAGYPAAAAGTGRYVVHRAYTLDIRPGGKISFLYGEGGYTIETDR